jgi:light-regulated signal transduction histidine kinase (bacteriophytochrome)
MSGASQRMGAVFDGLQSLFRLTGGEIHRERVDISALATEIAEEMRELNPDRQIKVTIAPELSASADARLMRILLGNLIGNAWKYTSTKQDAAVEVGREVVDGEVRHFVRDNGVGFDMLYSHKLFGAFQRLHSQDEFPGAGIGLATVRRIVNRHGGRCWAEGAVGEGATFYFVI